MSSLERPMTGQGTSPGQVPPAVTVAASMALERTFSLYVRRGHGRRIAGCYLDVFHRE